MHIKKKQANRHKHIFFSKIEFDRLYDVIWSEIKFIPSNVRTSRFQRSCVTTHRTILENEWSNKLENEQNLKVLINFVKFNDKSEQHIRKL